jgi:hypothetical protein
VALRSGTHCFCANLELLLILHDLLLVLQIVEKNLGRS